MRVYLPKTSLSEGMFVCENRVDGLARSENLVGLLIRELNVKLVLQCHCNLHLVQRVEAKVIDKVRV